MLVAYSTQDQAKLQVVAGSMREAFGVQDRVRYSGVIEIPVFRRGRSSRTPHQFSRMRRQPRHRPTSMGGSRATAEKFKEDRAFALAAASLRQAMQDMPDHHRAVQAPHGGGDQAGPQHRDDRSGWPLDVFRRVEGAQ